MGSEWGDFISIVANLMLVGDKYSYKLNKYKVI